MQNFISVDDLNFIDNHLKSLSILDGLKKDTAFQAEFKAGMQAIKKAMPKAKAKK
jgi:hypothetical protein